MQKLAVYLISTVSQMRPTGQFDVVPMRMYSSLSYACFTLYKSIDGSH